MFVITVLVVSVLVAIYATVLAWGAIMARRRERQRVRRLLAERLVVEGQMRALTAQTLLAMRQVLREHLAMRGRQ